MSVIQLTAIFLKRNVKVVDGHKPSLVQFSSQFGPVEGNGKFTTPTDLTGRNKSNTEREVTQRNWMMNRLSSGSNRD